MSGVELIIPGVMIVLGFLMALVGVYVWWHKYDGNRAYNDGLWWLELAIFATVAVLIGVGAGQAYHFANLLVGAR